MGGATGVCGLCGFGCGLCLLSFCVSGLRVSGLVGDFGFGVGIRFFGIDVYVAVGLLVGGVCAWFERVGGGFWSLDLGWGCGLDSGLLFG